MGFDKKIYAWLRTSEEYVPLVKEFLPKIHPWLRNLGSREQILTGRDHFVTNPKAIVAMRAIGLKHHQGGAAVQKQCRTAKVSTGHQQRIRLAWLVNLNGIKTASAVGLQVQGFKSQLPVLKNRKNVFCFVFQYSIFFDLYQPFITVSSATWMKNIISQLTEYVNEACRTFYGEWTHINFLFRTLDLRPQPNFLL